MQLLNWCTINLDKLRLLLLLTLYLLSIVTDATALSGLSATSQIIAENITCLGNETSTTECNATVPVITPSCFDSFPGRAAGVRCTQGITI